MEVNEKSLCGGESMVCVNCQRHIADGSNFCYNCGAKQPAPGAASVNAAEYGGKKRLVRGRGTARLRHPLDRIAGGSDGRNEYLGALRPRNVLAILRSVTTCYPE